MRYKLVGVGVLALAFSASFRVQAQVAPIPVYLSDEFVANTVTTSNQKRPSVAGNDDGTFLIVWHGDAAQTGFFDIKGQLFDRDGDPIGGEFQVDQGGVNRVMYTPEAAWGGNGNYVVVWADFNQTVTDSEIWMRRYDSAGNPLSGAVQVNTYTTGRQRFPRIAANDTGQFVVVWESDGQDGSGFGIFGQQFDAGGNPSGPEFAVNTYTTGNQDRAAVDIDALGFTVIFDDENLGIEARDVGLAALFDSPGGPTDQYNVFGPPHRSGWVTRISDGTSNTFMIGEASSHLSGRRYPDPAFPMGPGINPRVVSTNGDIWVAHDREDPLNPGNWNSWAVHARQRANGSVSQEGNPFSYFASTHPGVVQIAMCDGSVRFVAQRDSADGSLSGILALRGHDPGALNLDLLDGPVKRPDQSLDLGTVFENASTAVLQATGVLSEPLASLGAGLTINDGTADYGTIPAGGTGDCLTTGDCYNVTAQGPRPSPHWDESITETLSTGVTKTWLLHIGDSFADVPDTNLFYAFIENLLHNGITAGGACGGYCPLDGVKRQQMAVFLLKSRFGASIVPPPATGTIFTDVPITNPFAAWIEALFLLGITGGCSGGPPPAPMQFCPDAIVNRQQMAVFLLKTLEGSSYLPPDAVGIFTDVPAGNPFARWIEELYNRQVTGGCVPSPLQYCPLNPTNRQQMAAFLVKTFGLLLYGP